MKPPITTNVLVDMFRYNSWANREMTAFCRELPEDILALTAPGTSRKIQATLEHICWSEILFLSQMVKEMPPHIPEHGSPLDLAKVERLFGIIAGTWDEAAHDPGPADRLVTRSWGSSRAGALMAQVMHHGSEHRTQIATVLGAAGIELPRLDAWGYGQATA